MAYAYVDGNTKALDTISEPNQIKQVLHWIGFTDNTKKDSIFNDSISSYSDLHIKSKETSPGPLKSEKEWVD